MGGSLYVVFKNMEDTWNHFKNQVNSLYVVFSDMEDTWNHFNNQVSDYRKGEIESLELVNLIMNQSLYFSVKI